MADVRDYTNYLIYLCRCAVKGEFPDEGFPEELDFETFFRFCYDHQLVGLAYDMISKIKTGYEDTQAMLIFKDKHNYAVLKDASQDYYLGLIREAFIENNIDFTPLKGSVIKDMYPVPYYRQCTDIDILIDPDNAAKAKSLMEEIGFVTKRYGIDGSTDNYQMDKYVYVELHKQLIHRQYKEFHSCNSISERLILKHSNEYEMSDSDYYLFMIVHIAAHLKWSSAGIRAILDVWIYLNEKKDLDWKFINSEIEQCGLTDFHNKLRTLVDYWFEDKKPDENILAMADYIGESGWNGSKDHTDAYNLNRLKASDKKSGYVGIKNIFRTFFIDKAILQKRYPIINKYPYLVPVCRIHRGLEVLVKRRNVIASVYHKYDNADMERSKQINDMRRSFGL